MASVTHRNGRFLVRVRQQDFPTVTKTFTSKTVGLKWAKGVEAAMEAGKWAPDVQRVPTLKEVIGEYRVRVASKMKGADTYRYRFDEFERLAFAAKPVNEVTPFDLSAWRDDQSDCHKPGTVLRKLAMLSAVFTWAAKERGFLKNNPVSLVSKPRATDGRDRLLTIEEHQYLMAAAATSKAKWLPFALTVLLRSAMRRGELFKLRRRDVDYAASLAHLYDTKNGSPRDVPLCPAAISAIRGLDEAAPVGADTPLLPVGEVGSISTRFSVTIKRARAQYETDCKTTGAAADLGFLADIRLHDLRHGAISLWAETGGLSLPELMAISGHKTARMLLHYTHLSVTKLAGKMATINATITTGAAA